jgi:hypothetical protein
VDGNHFSMIGQHAKALAQAVRQCIGEISSGTPGKTTDLEKA